MTDQDFVDITQQSERTRTGGLFKNRTARQAIAGRAHLVASEVELWRQWAEDENCPEGLCAAIDEVEEKLKAVDAMCRKDQTNDSLK